MGAQQELNLFKKQKHFTLEDVDIPSDINLDVTFIDEQSDLQKAIDWLTLTSGKVGVDIETTGLDPYTCDIIMLQLGDEHRQFVIDTRVVDVSNLIPLLINKVTTLVGQNLKFEYKFFKHNYGVELETIEDTMIQEVCLYNGYGLRNGLKQLAERYLNYSPDKEIRMRFLEIGSDAFSKDEIIYGAYDVILPILISKKQRKKIVERGQLPLLELEHEYVKVLGDMEYAGMAYDKPAWKTLYDSNLIKYNKSIDFLNDYILSNKVASCISTQGDMFDSEPKVSLSWTSSKQVIELFKGFGICPQAKSKSTKKMGYTVDAKILKASLNSTNAKASDVHKDLIKRYLAMKELSQRVTTFGEKFFKYINPVTKRVHSNFRQIVSTGRSSSSGPNLQNIPSDAAYRACFIAAKGSKIINADFSGQENVVLVNKSLDVNLLEFYAKGNSDMHSFIASKIYDNPYEDFVEAVRAKDAGEVLTKAQKDLLGLRQIAKAAGFALAYGGNGHTIAKNLGISDKKGDEVYDAYFKAFPGLRKYFDKVIADTLKLGYVQINDITNRRLNLQYYKQMQSYKANPNKQKEYKALEGKIGRLALNAPVQGTAADITKAAAIKFRRWMNEEDIEFTEITNVIHDEINVESHHPDLEMIAQELERCMAEAGSMFCKTVPMTATAVIGTHWAH